MSSSISSWLNWASKNVDQSKLEQATALVKDAKQKFDSSDVGKEIKAAVAEEQQTTATTTTTTTGPQTTRQKYIRMAVKNWKFTLPVASTFQAVMQFCSTFIFSHEYSCTNTYY